MSSFNALRCDFCNGSLIMDDSREFAVCEFCGTKFKASTLRAKIQEIQGTVKVDGAVETTTGNAEKERRIKNAYKFLEINETKMALDEFEKLSVDFPNDIRIWTGLLLLVINHGINYSPEPIFKKANRLIEICQRISNSFNKEYYINLFFNNLLNGAFFVSYPNPEDFQSELGLVFNEQMINELLYLGNEYARALGFLGRDFIREYFFDISNNEEVNFFLGKTLIYTHYFNKFDTALKRIETKAPANQELFNFANQVQESYRNNNRCQHCGGTFKGLINPKCSNCGKAKDY